MRVCRSWRTKTCRLAAISRTKLFRVFRRSPTVANLQALQRAQAVFRREVRRAKRASWADYCGSLSDRSRVHDVWRVHRAISGLSDRRSSTATITDSGGRPYPPDTVLHLCAAYYLQLYEAPEGPRLPVIPGPPDECAEMLFSLPELHRALGRIASMTPGPDGITGPMLLHLPAPVLDYLLSLFNMSWTTGFFPSEWKHGAVTLIPKPQKAGTAVDHFRPITLLSQVGKLYERMVMQRLLWWLARTNWWADTQFGGIPGRGPHFAFEALLQNIFAATSQKHSFALLLLDVQRAFDTVTHDSIFSALTAAKLPPTLAVWLRDYVLDRTVRINVGGRFTDAIPLRRGVPQGAVLSAVLYNMATNNFAPTVAAPFTSQYIDDACVGASGKTARLAVQNLTLCLPRISAWADCQGLSFNAAKFRIIIFNKGCPPRTPVTIEFQGETLTPSQVITYLGISFDRRLTWAAHISRMIRQIHSVSNFLSIVRRPSWGAGDDTVRKLVTALVYSRVCYSSICVANASSTQLARLDVAINALIRKALGLPRSTNLLSLYAEAQLLPPLQLRERHLASLRYAMASVPCSPYSRGDVQNNPGSRGRCPTALHTVPLTLPLFHSSDIVSLRPHTLPAVPWWALSDFPVVSLPFQKGDTSSHNQVILQEFLASSDVRMVYYTDASLSADGTVVAGWFCASSSESQTMQLPDHTTIFDAEFWALQLAVEYISRGSVPGPILICVDSLSVLTFLLHCPSSHDTSMWYVIHSLVHTMRRNGTALSFLWVPSHSGIIGNDTIDMLVSKIRPQPKLRLEFGAGTLRRRVPGILRCLRQREWAQARTHYSLWKPVLFLRPPSLALPRPLLWILSMARVGRVGTLSLLHRWGMSGTDLCPYCPGETQDVSHILFECTFYARVIRATLPGLAWRTARTVLYPALLGMTEASPPIPLRTLRAVARVLFRVHTTNTVIRLPPDE